MKIIFKVIKLDSSSDVATFEVDWPFPQIPSKEDEVWACDITKYITKSFQPGDKTGSSGKEWTEGFWIIKRISWREYPGHGLCPHIWATNH